MSFGGGTPTTSTHTTDVPYDQLSDDFLSATIASLEKRIASASGIGQKAQRNAMVKSLERYQAEVERRHGLAKTLGDTGGVPPIDLPGMEAAGGLAAMKQKKRAQKNATLIEGQPSKETIAAGPKASLTRRSIVAY